MASVYIRIQRLLFTYAVLVVTLFASLPTFAGNNRGNKTNNKTDAYKTTGGNHGNGGGAVLCSGQTPKLTDFWESEHKRGSPAWIANTLHDLRLKGYSETLQYFAVRHNILDEAPPTRENELFGEMNNMMNAVYSAVKSGKTRYYKFNLDHVPINITVVIDQNAADPNDSGIIGGLVNSGCSEERVAVSFWDPGSEAGKIREPSLIIKIRRPDVFQGMPLFDQVGMIIGHEFINATTSGNVGNLALVSRGKSNSQMVRQLNAWISIVNDADLLKLRVYGPLKGRADRLISCSTVGPAGFAGPDTTRNESLFRFLTNDRANRTVFELGVFKKQVVWLTTYALFPALNGRTAGPFVQGRLIQVVPSLEKGLEAVDTGLVVKFSSDGVLTIASGSSNLLVKVAQCDRPLY